MDTALKRHGWLRDGNGLICLKAILKYRHGWAAHRADCKANKAANLRKQAVTTKCRGEFLCGAKSRDFEKAVDFCA